MNYVCSVGYAGNTSTASRPTTQGANHDAPGVVLPNNNSGF